MDGKNFPAAAFWKSQILLAVACTRLLHVSLVLFANESPSAERETEKKNDFWVYPLKAPNP